MQYTTVQLRLCPITRLIYLAYLNARFLKSSHPSKSIVFILVLKVPTSSNIRMSTGRAFQRWEPLYSNIRLPYLVSNFGVFSKRKSSGRPLKLLNWKEMLSEHCPFMTLNTIKSILNTILASTFNQCSSRRAARADWRRRLPSTNRAAEFCTFCNLYKFLLLMFMNRLLQ